jgi:molybdopterin-biosynthesis enzyme MoeA-like protein
MTSIGLFIIGDEILSGKRADKHFAKVVELLSARGLQLSWAQYLSDDRERLTAAFARSFASGDVVFSCGGIGATPDDHTRQAAAAALGVELALHPQAERLIAERTAQMAREGKGSADMSLPENRERLRMGEFPVGCDIVPNPFNRIPGFFIANHSFVPGFPVMAWPMIEWTLDTRYAHLHHRHPQAEQAMIVYQLMESTATPLMEAIQAQFAGVKVFSLPTVDEIGADGRMRRRHIELGVKGDPQAVPAAFEALKAGVLGLGGVIE